jgi:hypothetical protein
MLPNLVLFGLLALGLMAALTLFVTLKYELRVQARKDRARMDAMAKRLLDAERPEPEPAAPVPEFVILRSGMNMTKRVQAVRLLRRGEDVSHVAAALGVTRREVELLMRVQKLSAQRAFSAGAGG